MLNHNIKMTYMRMEFARGHQRFAAVVSRGADVGGGLENQKDWKILVMSGVAFIVNHFIFILRNSFIN